MADGVRGTVVVECRPEDVPACIRSAVAGIRRAAVAEVSASRIVVTQRSGVLVPRVEMVTLAVHPVGAGRSEIAITSARRGGLPAPDAVPSPFEAALLDSIRAAAAPGSR